MPFLRARVPSLVLGLTLTAALLWTAPASACSQAVGLLTGTLDDCTSPPEIPPNGIIEMTNLAKQIEDPSLLEPDATLSARLACASDKEDKDCPSFSRIRTGTAPGTRIRIGERSSCPLDAAVGGEADTTAPERPRIADVVVEMRSDPSDGGCMFCGDLDVMGILVANVRDDRAPRSRMYLAFYVGNTAEEALARTSIDHLSAVYDDHPHETPRLRAQLDPNEGAPARIDVGLGGSVGHERSGKGLLRAGPFCFAVETVDWAGNFSPRSEPVCLDTTDEKDSHVRWEESSSSCSVHRRSPAGSLVLALVTGLVLRLGRRRRPR